jgi:type IV pilus assembly protein PilM
MSQKILGLDIGSHSIKAALFDTAFRTYTLTDLFQSAPLRLEEAHPEEHDIIITESILQMIQKNNIDIKNVVTALSGKFISNRLLKLPLPPKQLAKVLPFEIENYIPFPLEDLIIDHHIIQTSKHETICLAAAAQKNIIENHIALLARTGIQPSFITFDTISLYNLNQFVRPSAARTYAIVDIGYQKTSICIITDQKIGLIRTLYTGGRDLDEAIRTEMNLTLDQAAEVKEKHGIIELEKQPLKSGDLQRLSGSIKKIINPLFQEIFQSFHLFRSQDWIASEAQKIEHVLFCGGSSLLRNLPEYFTQLLNIPSQRLYLLENQDPERVSRPKEPLFATAVGVGLKVSARGKNAALIESINFRKGDFSFSKSLGDFQDKIIFFGKWILVIFVLAFFQLLIKNNSLRHENNVIEKMAINEVKKIVPDDKSKSSKSAIKKLETKVQELQDKQDVLTSGLSKTTALGILRQLSVLISDDIQIDTKELSIEGNKITLRGNTDTFSSVDRIIANVQSFPEFTRIEKGDIRDTAEDKKSFMITILVGDEGKDKKKDEK